MPRIRISSPGWMSQPGPVARDLGDYLDDLVPGIEGGVVLESGIGEDAMAGASLAYPKVKA